MSILPSKGDGTFGAQTTSRVDKGPDDISFADFNNDGNADLVVTNYAGNSVKLLLGSSGGTFTVLGPFSVGESPYSSAVGDLNRDGTPDLVVSKCFSNNIGVLLGGVEIPPCSVGSH